MTEWLIQHFVADAHNTGSPAVRTRYGQVAGMVGIVCNVALCLAKGIIGLISGLRLHCGRRREQPLRCGKQYREPSGLQACQPPGRPRAPLRTWAL